MNINNAKHEVSRWNSKPNRRALLVLSAVLILFFFEMTFDKGALVEQIPDSWSRTGIVLGAIVGCYLSYWTSRLPKAKYAGWRIYAAITMWPILGVIFGSYAVRTIYEFAAFANYTPTPSQMSVAVTAKSTHRGLSARVHAYQLREPMQGNGRDIKVEIDGTLYANLEPYRHPGRDCLSLPVQIGRNGVKRFILPAVWFDEPLGIGHLTSCPR